MIHLIHQFYTNFLKIQVVDVVFAEKFIDLKTNYSLIE